MPGIKVRDNEGFESAMRRFKRDVEKSGVLSEVRRREFHETRSAKKKRASAAAVKRFRKKQMRDTVGPQAGGPQRGANRSSSNSNSNSNTHRESDRHDN